jgi:malonyl CoA-acyl carrier protein transacylase
MVPLIVQGDPIGILEVVDQKRSRQYSRQELRLAGAIAGQAAVAIKNAKLFAERRRSDEDVASLRRVLTDLTARVPSVSAAGHSSGVLAAVAGAVCEAFGAISCVASVGGESAGATGGTTQTDTAHVIVSSAPCGASQLALTLTLNRTAGEGQVELLGLIAAMAAGAIAGLPAT